MAAIAFGEVPPEAEKPRIKLFNVYILESINTNRYYIGHSSKVNRRLKEHNAGKVRSTKAYAPWKIVYIEKYETKSEAFKREMQIKKYKSGDAFRKLLESSLN